MRYLSIRKCWNMFKQTVGNRLVVHMMLRSAVRLNAYNAMIDNVCCVDFLMFLFLICKVHACVVTRELCVTKPCTISASGLYILISDKSLVFP
jgi:hypothetical protein